jgi:hypothetical protein
MLEWHEKTLELEAILRREHRDDFADWLAAIHQLSAECDELWRAYERAKSAVQAGSI